MEAISAKAASTRLAGIVWSDPKVGKTTWLMSLPGRKLLLNYDPDGFLSVAHRDDVDVIDFSIMPPQDAARESAKVAGYIIENKDKYGSIVVDSLTTMTDMALYDALYRGVGKSPKFTPTLDTPGLTGYGGRNNVVNDVCAKILRASAICQMHCFFTAHMDDPQYDAEGKHIVEQTIMLSGKIKQKVAITVSEIYHLSQGGSTKKVHLAPYGVKKPMGSRIFDTTIIKEFDLKYDISKPDEDQSCSLTSIINQWKAGDYKKLTTLPKI